MNNNLISMTPDGRYWIRRWRHIRETNMSKDWRGMKRLSALFTLPYWKVFTWIMYSKVLNLAHNNVIPNITCSQRINDFFSRLRLRFIGACAGSSHKPLACLYAHRKKSSPKQWWFFFQFEGDKGWSIGGKKKNHEEVTALSITTPRARQKKTIFSKLHHKNGSKFYQCFFMSRYTQYLLQTKNS